MIRRVELKDTGDITEIYNEYVVNSIVTFETEAVSEAEMYVRISEISSHYPYFVYEVNGRVEGYCYAHAWKERAHINILWKRLFICLRNIPERALASS